MYVINDACSYTFGGILLTDKRQLLDISSRKILRLLVFKLCLIVPLLTNEILASIEAPMLSKLSDVFSAEAKQSRMTEREGIGNAQCEKHAAR